MTSTTRRTALTALTAAMKAVAAAATLTLATSGEPIMAQQKSSSQEPTVAQRFVSAFGTNNPDGLRAVLADDVMFYGTLAWGLKGRENLVNFASEFQKGMPGLNVVLHDEFYNAEGTRGNMRIHLHFHNTGIFMGHQPTGKKGVSVESFSMNISDGKITELIQSGNSFPLAVIELNDFKMSYPTDTLDPQSAILSASPSSITHFK